MNDSNDNAKKDTLKVANPGRLQLTKTVESGKVKQNFTHGRSKSVTVEVRKTRTFAQVTSAQSGTPAVGWEESTADLIVIEEGNVN